MGFTSNDCNGVNFDNIIVAPKNVFVEPVLDGTKYQPETTSRFKEHYKINNPNIYYREDDLYGLPKIMEGPPNWIYKDN